MPLKRKFTIIIMCCLAINLLVLAGSFKLFLLKHPVRLDCIERSFIAAAEENQLSISSEDIHILVSSIFNTDKIVNMAFLVGIKNIVKASFTLLLILLIGVLYYIHREICKPIEKLNEAIQDVNDQNGYFTKDCNENEIKNLTSNFFLMAEQIEANKRKKDELISYITHDIRTPLTSISGYTQRLIEPGIADEAKRARYYQTILSKSNDMKVMIDELDSYITNEIQEITLEKVMINEFLSNLLNEYEDELLTYRITLHKYIDLPDSLLWKIDKKGMNRVFANIFSNAVSNGSPDMQIHFYAYESAHSLYINIENNGEGLNQEQYSKVFELMYQGDSSRTSKEHQGRGLGLTIVRQIITKHGGMVNAYAPSSGGFGIAIVLPYIS